MNMIDDGHTPEEIAAFERGVRDGEDGWPEAGCPISGGIGLQEAWLTGRSVGAINRRSHEFRRIVTETDAEYAAGGALDTLTGPETTAEERAGVLKYNAEWADAAGKVPCVECGKFVLEAEAIYFEPDHECGHPDFFECAECAGLSNPEAPLTSNR